MARFGYIKGTIGFYGKVDNYKGDAKEYSLRIDNPEFINIDEAALEEAFPLPKSKKDRERPTKIQSILDHEAVEKMYFNSSYPINKVWVKKDGEITEHKFENPQLKDMEVLMTLTGVHIGSILLKEVPEEYNPAPFNMDDFETEEDLPF